MLSLDEGVEEVFFDSSDCMSSEEFLKEDLLDGANLGYQIWLEEPQSVQKRRESFLRGMGFIELAKESGMVDVKRVLQSGGATSIGSASAVEDDVVSDSRDLNGGANCAVDRFERDQVNNPNPTLGGKTACVLPPVECRNSDMYETKLKTWWKHLLSKRKGTPGPNASKPLKPIAETAMTNRIKVRRNKKRYAELTAVYVGQEIRVHEGFIWAMAFSPDGRYVASGGEDGVIRIWRVTQADTCYKTSFANANSGFGGKLERSGSGRKIASCPSVILPRKAFHIEEHPVHEFHGHDCDVLDLAWSKSNFLLSSSEDKTVRLWQVGCNECLGVFQHNDYVTCIQFNPMDENYFISGSIDGKVRIWRVSNRRVVDWAEVRDVVTAVCYHPDGNGFVVGSIAGTCRFYGASGGGNLQLNAETHFQSRKKSTTNKITGIQFIKEDSEKIMITSEDSKVRILDGMDMVRKYKGLAKCGTQMSASVTRSGSHIVSVGEDSRVYLWNYDGDGLRSPSFLKQTHSGRSCEHFFSEGVSVAIPWTSSLPSRPMCVDCGSLRRCLPSQHWLEASRRRRDSTYFSCLAMDIVGSASRSSATWPEEKLVVAEHKHDDADADADHDNDDDGGCSHECTVVPDTWGLVIVTAGWDGTIRTFHNYGLPFRI